MKKVAIENSEKNQTETDMSFIKILSFLRKEY